MKQKTYFGLTSFVFLLVGVMHALRLLNGWHVVFGSTTIPLWVSWIGLIVGGTLSYQGYRLAKK
jgi:hypothetical protein